MILIFAVIYWSLVFLLAVLGLIKVFSDLYELIMHLCRRYTITHGLIVVPVRIIMNIISGLFVGILLFFHVTFLVLLGVFIIKMMYTDWQPSIHAIAYGCISMLFIPSVINIIGVIRQEYSFFNSK